jgi:hypothetical protein
MKTYVEIRSDAFPAYYGEEDVINPGRFGNGRWPCAGRQSQGWKMAHNPNGDAGFYPAFGGSKGATEATTRLRQTSFNPKRSAHNL